MSDVDKLTDDQVSQVAQLILCASTIRNDSMGQVWHERDRKELTWKEAEAARLEVNAVFIRDCRAALKEVLG